MADLTPVVLVHGLSGPFDNAAIRAELHPRTVFALDLLGYGACSEVPGAAVTLAAQIEHLRQDIEARSAQQSVHLVAHSVGGVIACLFAHRYPERVASLVCLDGYFERNPRAKFLRSPRMDRSRRKSALNDLAINPVNWLVSSGILSQRHDASRALKWLSRQPASSILATALLVVEATSNPEFGRILEEVFAKHPVHLIVRDQSQDDWEVPAWMLERAASVTVLSRRSHLMSEDLSAPGRAIAQILASSVTTFCRFEG